MSILNISIDARFRFVWISVALVLSSWTATADEPTARKPIAPFELPTAAGGSLSLPENAEAVVLCFLGTECPLARQYAPRLQKLADEYQSRGVVFIGIDSNLQDSAEEVEQFRAANNVRFAIAIDHDQRIAQLLGAERTPEVVVLDRRRSVRYQGRIDDQYLPGVAKPKPAVSELAEALQALLAGEAIRVSRTTSVGCLIGKPRAMAPSGNVTYSGQVARIFQTHCVECHRSGEIGPFSMTDYRELRGWGDMIVEVINDGRMPPWHAATTGHAALRNARSMPEADKQLVRDWVASGMPLGDEQQVPTLPEAKSEWHLPRTPDLIVSMRQKPYAVPAEGTVDYQYFVVDPGFTEERWISGAQVIPGNAGVVHHAIVFIRPPDGVDFRGVSWLTAYVPGQRHGALPDGSARRIPAGSKLVFQMHYTPNGQPQLDATKVGMTFVEPGTVKNEVITLMAINQEFEIPPHVADHPVTAKVPKLPAGGQLLAVSPHMHVRGKSFQLFSKQGDERQLLIDVPRYDFNWQHTYELAEPLPLDSIDGLEFTAKFDNSTGNPVNPNPNTLVTWGDQTWEEMAVAFFEVSQPLVRDSAVAVKERPNASETVAAQTAAAKFVADFLTRLDVNRDGAVHFDEAPLSIQRYSFRRFDHNNDRKIDRDELMQTALQQ